MSIGHKNIMGAKTVAGVGGKKSDTCRTTGCIRCTGRGGASKISELTDGYRGSDFLLYPTEGMRRGFFAVKKGLWSGLLDPSCVEME